MAAKGRVDCGDAFTAERAAAEAIDATLEAVWVALAGPYEVKVRSFSIRACLAQAWTTGAPRPRRRTPRRPRRRAPTTTTTTTVETTATAKKTQPRPTNGAPPLPALSDGDKMQLAAGLRVQRQTRDGGAGSGLVVFDARGTPEDVWRQLAAIERYRELIPTVRRVEIRETSAERGRRGAVTAALRTRALFVMSKFCIRANVVHAWRPEDDALEFALDARSTNVVIKEAAGFWHVEEAPEDRGPGWVRVWLSAHVRISRAVPGKVVDYAASRALPRATVWLQELLSR